MVRKNRFNRKIKALKRNLKKTFLKYKSLVFVIAFLVFSLILIRIWFKYYIDNPKNLITKIYFDKQIVDNPNYYWLIKFTQKKLLWENTVKNKFYHYFFAKESITKKYPFVKDLEIQILSSSIVKVSFEYKKPYFSFVLSWTTFLVYWEKKLFWFDTNLLTWILNDWYKIYLPWYINKDNNLNLIFWKTSLKTIYYFVKEINKKFLWCKIYFLPWAEYMEVLYKNKKYLFNLKKNLHKQIEQLDLLKTQLPNKFDKSLEIDLWSLKNKIFIK